MIEFGFPEQEIPAGILIGFVLNFLYLRLMEILKPVLKTQNSIWRIFEIFEHYHWGFVFLLFNYPLDQGIASSLFIQEGYSPNLFGYKTQHFKSSTIVGFILLGILILRYVLF